MTSFKGYHPPSRVLDEIIRVNHAGESGAKRIYEGQLDALKHHSSVPLLQHMYQQELQHLQAFDDLMKQHHVRPTVFSPLWHGAAYGLGWISGKMGVETAMAITVAVEEVIERHYANQIEILKGLEGSHSLAETLETFRQEEVQHQQEGLHHQAEKAPFYPLIKNVVKAATKLAIFLSKKW